MTDTGIIHEHHHVGVKLTAGEEAEAVAEVVTATHPDARVEHFPAYISIVAPHRLTLELPLVSEQLGRPYDVPTFLVILSSYHGHIQVEDERVSITAEAE